MPSARSVLGYGFTLAVGVTLAACSAGGGTPAANPPPKVAATTSTPVSAASPSLTPAPAASATPSLSGVLTVSFSGLASGPSLGYGGAPVQFTVTLSNGTSSTYRNITPLVYLGPCTCVAHAMVPTEPQGTMEVQDASTGQWHSIFFDHVGGGMDYLLSVQQFSGITLAPGATMSYTLRMAFNPLSQQGSADFGSGQTSIDATVVTLPDHTVIGTDPAAKIPLTVTMS